MSKGEGRDKRRSEEGEQRKRRRKAEEKEEEQEEENDSFEIPSLSDVYSPPFPYSYA